jgi:hypothetical protein
VINVHCKFSILNRTLFRTDFNFYCLKHFYLPTWFKTLPNAHWNWPLSNHLIRLFLHSLLHWGKNIGYKAHVVELIETKGGQLITCTNASFNRKDCVLYGRRQIAATFFSVQQNFVLLNAKRLWSFKRAPLTRLGLGGIFSAHFGITLLQFSDACSSRSSKPALSPSAKCPIRVLRDIYWISVLLAFLRHCSLGLVIGYELFLFIFCSVQSPAKLAFAA